MANLSTKELGALDDQLNYEQMLVKKYRAFAAECSDQNLSTKCNQIADVHQKHFNTLISYLQ